MAVYRNESNGTWYVSCGYKDWTGKRHHMTKRGFRTKAEAKKWESAFVARGEKRCDMNFEDFVELYWRDREGRLKQSTLSTKRHIVETKILPFFSGKKLCEITPADVIEWQNELLATEGRNGEKYSQSYMRTVNNQLSAIFNHAVRFYGLQPSPAAIVGKVGSRETGEMSFWTPQQFKLFADAVSDKAESYYAFELLYWTGIREGELLALTPADLDLEARTLTINKTYSRINGIDYITPPKTPKSNRVIALSESIALEMGEYLAYLAPIGDDERMFNVKKGYLQREMKRGCALAGLERIRIHDLRHSHVSLLIELGFSALGIAERLGHESIDITYRYAHLFPSKQVVMAEALDGLREEGK